MAFADEVEDAISKASSNVEVKAEDSDEWLNVDAQDIDDMLSGAMSGGPSSSSGRTGEDQVTIEQAARLKSLSQKVEEFIEGEGDIEGVRFAE